MSFWPSGITVDRVASPETILEEARQEWWSKSNGIVDLILLPQQTEAGLVHISVQAINNETNRSASLFAIVHRAKSSYPVTIELRDIEDIPNRLRKKYVQPAYGRAAMMEAALQRSLHYLEEIPEKTVENPWVCDTPDEFRDKLEQAFDSSGTKSLLINLLAVERVDGNGQSPAGESEAAPQADPDANSAT